jgi:hypothetical protein
MEECNPNYIIQGQIFFNMLQDRTLFESCKVYVWEIFEQGLYSLPVWFYNWQVLMFL